jgi:hypothetical protein
MMGTSRFVLFFVATIFAVFCAQAAPPVGGVPSIEESVARGCKDFELVFVADAIRVREASINGEIWETAELSLISVIKGAKQRVPATFSLPKKHPNRTDQDGDTLEAGMTYLMFIRPHPIPGWEGHIMRKINDEVGDPRLPIEKRPVVKTDTSFQYALALARKACR